MARVHFVKAARKDNQVVKKGESYYWWKPMIGGRGGPKRYSKTRPTRAQLTTSPFLSALYALEDDLPDAMEAADLEDLVNQLEELRDECETSLSNMPESLQYSPTGELLQERIDGLQSWIDEIASIDTSPLEEEQGEDEDEEAYEARLAEARREIAEQAAAANPGLG